MYLKEIFAGRYESSPDLTAFPNVTSYDELYLVGPITIRSTCAHHLQNIRGNCWIGIYRGRTSSGCRSSTGSPSGSPRGRRSRRR
jgi:GTP cyclohydrolase I